jgi:TolB-like protein/DNA-binding winged helix-turn-helix (wHTH) protein/Tfp pilus assembly protein PilF
VTEITPSALPKRFGAFEFDPRARQLRKHGRTVRLHGQPLEILGLLLERPAEVVLREELRAKLWPGDTFVDFAHSLNAAVNKLRDALSDDANVPRFIETVPRRGYRFIAPVEGALSALAPESTDQDAPSANREAIDLTIDKPAAEVPASSGARIQWWTVWLAFISCVFLAAFLVGFNVGGFRQRFLGRPDPIGIRSLAVLPLENLSHDAEQEYFADGMTEALTTELAQISALKVISRTSVMQYKGTKKSLPQIAKELGVDAVVEGAVQRSGDKVGITFQLIQAPTDRHLLAKSYERDLRDVLALQREIAHAIADEIKAKLTPQEQARLTAARTANPEAHDLYMHGVALRDNNDAISLEKSIEWFRRSIQKDPDYAPAHAGLAVAYTFQSYLGVLPSRETFPKAETEARRAIALDPSLAKAHDALAWVAYVYKWDWPLAEKELRRALELNANDVDAHHYYSHYLFTMGRLPEALAEGEVAAGLDPLSQIQKNHLLWQYVEAKEYDRAMEVGKKIVQGGATDPVQYVLFADSYVGKGQFEQAIPLLQKAISLSPTRTEPQAALAGAYVRMGKANEARKMLRRLEKLPSSQFVSPIGMATVYCALGEKERALESLEKAIEQHDASVSDLPSLPGLDPLRGDPGFQNLLRRVGLLQ